jgi:hypothetical protein
VNVDGTDESDLPGLIQVYAAGNGFMRGTGTLHRYDTDHRCETAPDTIRSSTDLITAAVSSDHKLCPYCEWPDGAEEVLNDGE